MAVLTTAQQALLQDAIDLMVKGTAVETPLAEDVVERIARFVRGVSVIDASGALYAAARDIPKSLLIEIVAAIGFPVLTRAQEDQLASAANLMLIGTAYETPFAEDVIQRLAPVADSSGFMSRGAFYEAIRDRPVSTMLRWALQLGS